MVAQKISSAHGCSKNKQWVSAATDEYFDTGKAYAIREITC